VLLPYQNGRMQLVLVLLVWLLRMGDKMRLLMEYPLDQRLLLLELLVLLAVHLLQLLLLLLLLLLLQL
jgi:hypothetical protein